MIPFASHRDIDRLRSAADIIEQLDELTTYLGFCQPGTLTTAEDKWSIMKIVEAATGDPGELPTVTTFQWADGSCAYNLVWDDRADYDYYFKNF